MLVDLGNAHVSMPLEHSSLYREQMSHSETQVLASAAAFAKTDEVLVAWFRVRLHVPLHSGLRCGCWVSVCFVLDF